MRTRSRTVSVGMGLTMILAGSAAGAQETGVMRQVQEELAARPLTLQVGAGMANFTERGTKAVTDPGVLWTARGVLDIGQHFGAELAYLGSARPAQLDGVGDASVLHNGVEALARAGRRFSFGALAYLSPYAAAGVGWGLYSLVGEDGSVAGLRDDDGVFTLPLAVGVASGYGRLGADLRFSYRPAFGDEMFRDVYDGIYSDGLNSLSLSAALGYSF